MFPYVLIQIYPINPSVENPHLVLNNNSPKNIAANIPAVSIDSIRNSRLKLQGQKTLAIPIYSSRFSRSDCNKSNIHRTNIYPNTMQLGLGLVQINFYTT